MAQIFPNLVENINLQPPEAQQMPRINITRAIPQHIIVHIAESERKKENLERAREK